MRNNSFKFSQEWLSNSMESRILLDAQVQYPANYADLVTLKPLITLEREEILRSSKLHSSLYRKVLHVRPENDNPKFYFIGRR